MYTFWNVYISNMTADYGRFSFFIAFFWHFNTLFDDLNFITSSNFYKFCVKAEIQKRKVNLCNNLWLR